MTFSVVVPTYNRCESLKLTIESIRNQDFRDFEIIIVNDGSTDGTREFLTHFQSDKLTIINQQNLGPSRARNAGIEKARGTYVAFTDDDCKVPSDWLASLHRALSVEKIDIAGGSVNNTLRDLYSDASQQMTNYFVRELAHRNSSSSFLTSNNVAYPASVLKTAGGFDARFTRAGGEERALHMKIIDRGGRSVYLPDCIVDHAHRLSLGGFLRQQFNYGKGSFLIYRVAGRELKHPPESTPLSIYLGYFRDAFADGIALGVVRSILFIVAQLASLCGYFVESARPRIDIPLAHD